MSSFRGEKGIREIAQRVIPLAEYQRRFNPGCKHIVLARADYDLIKRWPRAAHIHDFDVTENGMFFRGFRLSYTGERGRYEQEIRPDQAVIE